MFLTWRGVNAPIADRFACEPRMPTSQPLDLVDPAAS